MSSSNARSTFRTPEAVIERFEHDVRTNGDPHLAGLEEEIVVLDAEGRPLPHDAFQDLVGALLESLPEGKIIEGTNVNGAPIPVLKGTWRDGSVQPETNTTLVEYAHAPRDSAWGCQAQSLTFSEKLIETASARDLVVIGCGAIPTMTWDDFYARRAVIPNSDFVYSWTHMMQGTRPEYCRTVFGTASVHHNMGFNDPERMARYISTTLRLQPTMIALLGNSPLWNLERAQADGQDLLSYRSRVQIDYGHIFGAGDGTSYLYPDFLIDPNATFASIVQGYLDLPLDRTLVNGKKRSCNGTTMRDYLRDGIEADGATHRPTLDALTMMVREPIVDVRPSFLGSAPRVETRAHDNVSQSVAVALDAFYRGISANLDAAAEAVVGMEPEEIRRQRHAVCAHGLATPLRHTNKNIGIQADMALCALEIAAVGLINRGQREEELLAPLIELAQSGRNPATRLLQGMTTAAPERSDVLNRMKYDRTCFADNFSPSQNARPALSCTL